MSIKYVLAIPIFCCVFLVAINAQSQPYDDKKFKELKARDRYKPLVPIPSQQQDSQGNLPQSGGNKKIPVEGSQTTPRPQRAQQDSQRNRYQNGGNRQEPVAGSQPTPKPQSPQQGSQTNWHQNNHPQNIPHLEPLFYYPNFIRTFQRQEFIRSSDFQMNSLELV